MGTHPIFESDFDCLTEGKMVTEADSILLAEINKIQSGAPIDSLKELEESAHSTFFEIVCTFSQMATQARQKHSKCQSRPWPCSALPLNLLLS